MALSSAPTSTIDTFLMVGSGSGTISYSKLCDIKDYPDLIGAPEPLETTTLSNRQRTFIEGLKSGEQLTFTANYSESAFSQIVGYAGVEKDLAVYFGASALDTPDGHDGKFTFKGYVSCSIVGKGVNEVREMSIIITPTTEISFAGVE